MDLSRSLRAAINTHVHRIHSWMQSSPPVHGFVHLSCHSDFVSSMHSDYEPAACTAETSYPIIYTNWALKSGLLLGCRKYTSLTSDSLRAEADPYSFCCLYSACISCSQMGFLSHNIHSTWQTQPRITVLSRPLSGHRSQPDASASADLKDRPQCCSNDVDDKLATSGYNLEGIRCVQQLFIFTYVCQAMAPHDVALLRRSFSQSA